jgi:hypothetical protein
MAPDRSDGGRQRREQALIEFSARGVNLRRRHRLDAVAVETIDALHRAGIDALLLKGAALAETLYGPDLERGYFDIDLMVAPANRAISGQVLSKLGYTSAIIEHGIEDVSGVLHAEPWSRLDAEIGNVMIDLHWKLYGALAPSDVAWHTLRGGAEPVTVAGRVVLRLGRPALALHIALHLAQHGSGDAKAASDLELAIVRWEPDVWHEAARLAVCLEAIDAFAIGLRLVPDGARMADRLGVFPTEAASWEMEHRDVRPRGTQHLLALGEARTLRARAAVLRRALLPRPAWIRSEIRWAHRSRCHLGAAYVLHLLRSPLWAARAFRFACYRSRHPPN